MHSSSSRSPGKSVLVFVCAGYCLCLLCQTGRCGSSLLFCKIPNLISIFVSSCFANPAAFSRIYLIRLSVCKIVLPNQPGSGWTSKLKPWPRCILPQAESDFLFTICCRGEEREERRNTRQDWKTPGSYLALEKQWRLLRVDDMKLHILWCKPAMCSIFCITLKH